MPIDDQLIMINDLATNDNDFIALYSSKKNNMASNVNENQFFEVFVFIIDKAEPHASKNCTCIETGI